MHRHTNQRGAALILLLGIIATLAILSATLVFVIENQQKATANERSHKKSFYAAEAALDSAVRFAKVHKTMSTTAEWLTPADLAAAFNGAFPAGATVTYRVYDDLATVDYGIKWDQGGPTSATTPDHMVWVEATVTYQGKTTRARVLIQQTTKPFAAALPKVVTYSDTGIMLQDNSDIYAVDPTTGNPDDSGPPYQTSITAGGTWTPSLPSSYAEVGRFTGNSSTDLAARGHSIQSLGITANGSVVTPGHSFTNVLVAPGSVGYLSDYFDQAAQTSLASESQVGGTHAAAPTAPTAPSSWTSSGFTAITGTTTTGVLGTLMSTTSTATYDATSDLYLPTTLNSGNLTLSRGTNTTGRTFNFRRLYVAGNLTLTGPVTVNATSLYVGGTITINNATTTSVTDSVGPLYVAGTGASSVSGRVNLNTTSAYTGGAFTITNSTSTVLADSFGSLYVVGALGVTGPVGVTATSAYTGGALTISNSSTNPAVTDTLGAIYAVGDMSVSGNVTTSAASYLYAGGNATISNTTSTLFTDQFGLIYTSGTSKTLTFSGNVQIKATAVVANGDFTISGATTAFTDWLGQVFVAAYSSSSQPSLNHGDVDWSGTASVTSRDYTQQTVPTADVAQPKPLWLGRHWTRSGTYNDEYGNIWVPGNSSWSITLGSTGNSTMMCPLLCTTEHPQVSGHIDFGTRDKPMVFFYMCDNNGIYPQVVDWACTGTYYGLMVINESTIDITNGVAGTPSIQGALFAGCPYDPTHTSGMSKSDIVLEGNSSIAYDQHVVGQIATSSLKTTITVTQTVPGSWQQLPAN